MRGPGGGGGGRYRGLGSGYSQGSMWEIWSRYNGQLVDHSWHVHVLETWEIIYYACWLNTSGDDQKLLADIEQKVAGALVEFAEEILQRN